MNKFTLLLFSILAVGMFSSCDNDDDGDDGANLLLNYKVGDANFEYETVYDIGGTAVSFDFAQFYMSGISVMDDGGAMNSFTDNYILAKPEQSSYELGTIDINHIHMLNFTLGIDEATNNQTTEDFTSYPADSPLALQSPVTMHWSWNAGYVFLKINAKVDTDGDGTPETDRKFHIGTNALATPVAVMIHNDNETDEIGINFDVAKLFTGIDLSTGVETQTMDNMELAQQITQNYATAFTKQ